MSKRAGAVSVETKAAVIQAARNEFSEHGFQGSSLRRICSAAGVTTGALYFFFDGKDDLFETVISEVTVPFMSFMRAHYESEHTFLSRAPADNEQADFEISLILMDFYFQNQQTWDILLGHLNHPAVQRFMDSFIDYSTDHYAYLLSLADRAYPRTHPVDHFAIHQFVHMQVDTMLTLVSHGFSHEEMIVHSKTVTRMLKGAFRALLSE